MSWCLGVASKALLMSNVMRSVLLCGSLWLQPLTMLCVSCVSNVFVECCGLKPCCVDDSGMYGVTMFSMRRSITLKSVLRSVIGLYDDASVGSLFGFRMVMMMPCFQVSAILQCE